jgi:predicted amidophosphoribosyltransferase
MEKESTATEQEYCPFCKADIVIDQDHCGVCGATLKEEPPAPPEEEKEEESSDENVEEKIAAELAQRISRGWKIRDKCEKEIIKSIKIDGKNLAEWGDELRVKVPDDPDDLEGLERSFNSLATSIQKAEYILGVFELQAKAARNTHEAGFATRFVSELKAKKSQGKMSEGKIRQLVLVDKKVDSSLATAQSAELVVDYFKRVVKGLEIVRKSLENRVYLTQLRTASNAVLD